MVVTGEADASSSSGTNLEKCYECEEELCADSAVFCLNCEFALCTLCDEHKVHTSRTTHRHERINIVQYRLDLNESEIDKWVRNDAPIRDEQVDVDLKNKFCHFCPFERRIIVKPRLATLVKDAKSRPSLVSLIGPTGVGKSFLLRFLLLLDGVREEKDMPLLGAASDTRSTSSDIHLYAGRQDSAAEPLLYLDSEGRGGSKHPHGLIHMLESFKKHVIHIDGGYTDRRYEHVQSSFPRMLYIFSDVVCFVFSGDRREKLNIIEPLLDWGRTASFGADNQHLPQLIIIFSKTDVETYRDEYDDFEKAFKRWIGDNERLKDLLCYYSNPLVVYVPHMDFPGAPKKVRSRMAKLRQSIMKSTKRIRSERRETNLLFTRRQLEQYMRKAAVQFSENPKAKFDIYKAMVADSATVELKGYIVTFRREVEHAGTDAYHRSTSSNAFLGSLNVLHSSLKQSMLLWISRNLDVPFVASAKLPREIRKALVDAGEIIDGETPCDGPGEGNCSCGTMKRVHKGYHSGMKSVYMQSFSSAQLAAGQLASASIEGFRSDGAFRPHPDVENAMKACSLVDLAESVFESVSGKDAKAIREMLATDRRSARAQYTWLDTFTSYQVCVICLLNLPTEMLSCGHIICEMCAKEEAGTQTRLPDGISMVCPVCLLGAKWYPKHLPPLAGYRILSLDGGGVRGIVQLLLLEAIMAYFPDMHVEDLFDIVIGTSTGGIIALALTVHEPDEKPKRVPGVIELFKNLAGDVFSPSALRFGAGNRYFWMFCNYFRIYDSKYKNDILLKLLEQHLGEQSLLRSCVGGPRVIITACDVDKELAAAWFTSYNFPRPDADENESDVLLQQEAHRGENEELGTDSLVQENESHVLSQRQLGPLQDEESISSDLVAGRVPDCHLFSAKEVAAATSAAQTYLPLFKAGNHSWADGGLRFNGPPMIAIDEARRMWPERRASALISLGCGLMKNEEGGKKLKGQLGMLKLLKLVVDIAFDAENQCNHAVRRLKELQPEYPSGPGLRLNPTIRLPMGETCELDDTNKMDLLIDQTRIYLESGPGKAVVERAANLLLEPYSTCTLRPMMTRTNKSCAICAFGVAQDYRRSCETPSRVLGGDHLLRLYFLSP